MKFYFLVLQSVYMAHALKRISYATCEPEFRQFSFLAREPKGHIDSQFCHVFMTKTPDEVRKNIITLHLITKIENGNGECVKEKTTQPKSIKQPKATNRSSTQ